MSRKRSEPEEEEVVEIVEEDDDDEEYEEVVEKQKPAKKQRLMKENENAEMYGDLGRGKRVTVRAFQGRIGVDIREFYEKDGKTLPGKKGIWLTKDNFVTLLKFLPEIEAMVEAANQ